MNIFSIQNSNQSNSSQECIRYNQYNEPSTVNFFNSYEGIPQNLVINILAFTVLMLLFLIIRKKAWNYGKLGWIIDREAEEKRSNLRSSIYKSYTSEDTKYSTSCSWFWKCMTFLPLFIKLSDKQLKMLCGKDAVLYCRFQRNLIFLVLAMMVPSILIILPLNFFSGFISKNTTDFVSFTIQNVDKDDNRLWGHFTVALFILVVSFIISTRFMRKVDSTKKEISNTLLIENIPVQCCDELVIEDHFREAYPTLTVTKVQVCYKYEDIIQLNKERTAAEDSLEYCYNQLEANKVTVQVVPKLCGRISLFCKCSKYCCCATEKCQPVDGIDYYSNQVEQLTEQMTTQKMKEMTQKKLPLIFVSFASAQEALNIRRDYVLQDFTCDYKQHIPKSQYSEKIRSGEWKVEFAPDPNDIKWENIHLGGWVWYLRWFLLISAGAIYVLIFTTPTLVLNLLNNDILKLLNQTQKDNPIVSSLLPAFILLLTSSLLPIIVSLTVRHTRYWTLTTEQTALMNQVYTQIVLCVLILPSLGLNSVPQLITFLFIPNQTGKFRWECIFMPDGGALFCNYLISASFLGVALEFLRFGDIFILSYFLMMSKSKAEEIPVTKKVVWSFEYGLNYAWTLAIFTMIAAYAVIVPIITIFGFVYLVFKHIVDRYNMIHVTLSKPVDKSVHLNAATLMQVALLLTQSTVTIYVSLRSVKAIYICCAIVLALAIFFILSRCVYRSFSSVSWIKYKRGTTSSTDNLTGVGVSGCAGGETMDLAPGEVDLKIMQPEEVTNQFIPIDIGANIRPSSNNILNYANRRMSQTTPNQVITMQESPKKSSNYGTIHSETGDAK